MKPGIYDMSAEAYHSDPADAPSLSASIAHALCAESPLHAWTRHPKLNPEAVDDESEKMDIGTIAHALLLQGTSVASVLDFPDWRTNKAKDARQAARDAGKVPILAKNWNEVQLMVAACRIQLEAHRDAKGAFADGMPEQSLFWTEDNGVACRARLDWLSTSRRKIFDYKTTGASANPEVVSRTLFANGWDVQCAFYLRGIQRLTGIEASFQFIVQETYPPYALSVIALGPDSMMIAEKKILWAIDKFHECLKTGTWPGYPLQTCYATLPVYIENQWLQKETAHL